MVLLFRPFYVLLAYGQRLVLHRVSLLILLEFLACNKKLWLQIVQLIDFIKCMRTVGLPLEILKEYTSLVRQGADEALEKRREILMEERKILLKKQKEMAQVLQKLDTKINDYEGRLASKETAMKNLSY